MQEHIVALWWYIQANWDTILTYIAASGFIATLVQYIKKKLDVVDKKKILAVVGALSVIPDAINALASNPSWANALPANMSWLFTGAVAIHAFLVSPLWKKTATALRPYFQAVQDIKSQNNISNKNNKLNQPSESVSQSIAPPKPVEVPEEQPPLVIQG